MKVRCRRQIPWCVGGYIAVMLAVTLTAASGQQTAPPVPPQAASPDASTAKAENVTTYHAARDETTVSSPNLQLIRTPQQIVAFSAAARYKGKTATGRPEDVTLMVVSLSNGYRFPPVSLLTFIADDRHLPSRRAVRLVAEAKDNIFVESIAAILPSDMFAEIAGASRLEATLHEARLEFAPAHLAVLQALTGPPSLWADAPRPPGVPAPGSINPQRNSNSAVLDTGPGKERFALNQQLVALYQSGEFEKAAVVGQRLIEVTEKEVGGEGSSMATTLNNVGIIYKSMGRFDEAIQAYRRVLDILRKLDADQSLLAGVTLDNLGNLYSERGDFDEAMSLTRRAVTILEREVGPDHPDFATALSNLANLQLKKGDNEGAIALMERALRVLEKAKGPYHPDVATVVDNLAVAYGQGGYAQAETYGLRAIAIYEQTLGKEHPEVAKALANLGRRYIIAAAPSKAEPILQRAAQTYRATDDPELPRALRGLADAREAQGDPSSAIGLWKEAQTAQERLITLMMRGGSEKQKRTYLAGIGEDVESVVSLHTRSAPADKEALELAFTMVLQRKGRALEATSHELSFLRDRLSAEDRELFDRSAAARGRLASAVLAGAGRRTREEHRRAIDALQAEVDRLEADLSQRSAPFRGQAVPVTLEAIRAAGNSGSALVEFVTYRPNDPKTSRYELRRFAAYVLRPEGDPQWVDLGNAALIESDITELRNALANPRRTDVTALAKAVDTRVLAPIRPLIGRATRLFISPDGVLSLLPFGVLVDNQGRHAAETLNISYVTTGRDLLRLAPQPATAGAVVVVADPDFDRSDTPSAERSTGDETRLDDLPSVKFQRLRGTAEEARSLKVLLPSSSLLTGPAASEQAVRALPSPRILHVATHGFFLRSTSTTPAANHRGLSQPQSVMSDATIPNALMRSGLVLAGANARKGGASDDGFLTGLELTSLDLSATELVVLSACETGLGDVQQGEGVYGLRRALVLAGSRSQVMSLWRVDDAATRDLMVAFYRRLLAGAGRADALREAQLEMLANPLRKHPYYWASFIQSGDWRPIASLK